MSDLSNKEKVDLILNNLKIKNLINNPVWQEETLEKYGWRKYQAFLNEIKARSEEEQFVLIELELKRSGPLLKYFEDNEDSDLTDYLELSGYGKLLAERLEELGSVLDLKKPLSRPVWEAWLEFAYPQIYKNLYLLMAASEKSPALIEETDSGYNWTSTAALLAGLINSSIGGPYDKGLVGFFTVKNRKITDRSFHAEIYKRTIPRNWHLLKAKIPEISPFEY